MANCASSRIVFGSLTLDVVSPVHNSLCCSICTKVLSDPQRTPCGCRFCLGCISKYLLGMSKLCPGGTASCGVISLKENVRDDSASRSDIIKLSVRCPFGQCHAQCEVRQIEAHMECCGRKNDSVDCTFCGVTMTTLLLKTVHHNYDHGELCEKYVDNCPNVCGEVEKVCWKSHAGTCAVAILSCPYERFGCETKCRRMEMSKHLVDEAQKHTEELLKHIDHLGNEMTTMKTELEKVGGYKKHSASSNLANNIAPLKEQIKSIEDRMEDIAAKVTFYDGNFRWTMTNYFLDQRGSRLSPSFYTDERGYRMQLEISTDNQYGFLSVYVKIYPGNFDDELRWPFDKRVTIRILDQDHRGRHYTKSVYFDNSPKKCRKKPNMTSNHGYGEPAFIRINELESKDHLFCEGRIWIDCFVEDDD